MKANSMSCVLPVKRIFVAYDSPVELAPPVLSLLELLKARQTQVFFVDVNYTSESVRLLKRSGIPFATFQKVPFGRFWAHPFLQLWFRLVRRYRKSSFCMKRQRRFLWKKLNQFIRGCDEGEVIVWTANTISAAILGDELLKFGRRHVLWVLEYGEERGREFEGFSIDRMYESSTLVQCEQNRARLMQKDKGLANPPFVMPNKPYGHPRQRNLLIADTKARRIVESWGDKRVFLYQGSLGADRKGILQMIEWLCQGFPDAIVAVMSAWGFQVEEFTKKYANFSYIPFVPPPAHLEITSHADIGIAVYSQDQVKGISPLNAVYCAPNKTFECAGFGIPLLCNNPPGLKDSVGRAGAAICIDEFTKESVIAAARKLLDDYDQYSSHASHFFDSVDMDKIVDEIVSAAIAGRKE